MKSLTPFKKIKVFAIALFLVSACLKPQDNESELNYETFFLAIEESSNWPKELMTKMEAAIAKLVSAKSCWSLKDDKVIQVHKKTIYPCSRFENFKNIGQLKPYRKYSNKKKLLISYRPNNPQGELGVKIFDWDGRKIRRIRNSGSSLKNRTISEFIVKWSLK